MMKASDLRGVIAAIPTLFTPEDELDVEGLETLVNFCVDNGVHGIMTTGGNGEFPHLLPEERKQVLETTIETVNGRVPVIACTTACSTKETVLYTEHAETEGADAAIVVPPYYFNLPSEQIFEYYEDVARNTQLPIVVYNNPNYTKNPIPPELMERILDIEGMIGVKQSESNISQATEIIRTKGEEISVMTGIDSQFFPALCIGAKGIFSTASSVVPGLMVELYETFQEGEIMKALELHKELQALNRFFEYDPGYVAPCKEALSLMGMPSGHARAPLPSLSDKDREKIEDALIRLSVLAE